MSNPLQQQIKEEVEDYDPQYLIPQVPVAWDDFIVEEDESSARPFLGSLAEPIKQLHISGYLAVTVNYPRTPAFIKLDQKGQCNFYNRMYNTVVKNYSALISDTNSFYSLEHCKSGQIHMHAQIALRGKYFIAGAISDIVKAFKLFIPKGRKYRSVSLYSESNYYASIERYRDAHIVVQHFDWDNPRVPQWETYIVKEGYYNSKK